MFAGSLPLLILLVAAIGFWLDAARARELASALAQELCARHGVQFLDGSASLSSLSLKRTPQGLRFQRVFGFSYFTEVGGRREGSITVVGARIRDFQLEGRTTIEGEESG